MGADQTLVAAAYRAAMANVPKDLSGTFEALATNYANTMKIVGDSWANVATTVGKLGAEAVDNALYQVKMGDKARVISNKTNTTFLTDSLDGVKQKLKDTWSLKDGNNPFSKENRALRIEGRQERDKLNGSE